LPQREQCRGFDGPLLANPPMRAIFKSLELFYGTNDFNAADAAHGADQVTAQFILDSNEPNSGGWEWGKVFGLFFQSRRLFR